MLIVSRVLQLHVGSVLLCIQMSFVRFDNVAVLSLIASTEIRDRKDQLCSPLGLLGALLELIVVRVKFKVVVSVLADADFLRLAEPTDVLDTHHRLTEQSKLGLDLSDDRS
jgi:hypothetical protein